VAVVILHVHKYGKKEVTRKFKSGGHVKNQVPVNTMNITTITKTISKLKFIMF
jgi:hypothetical protein